jgi:hypothetical protein
MCCAACLMYNECVSNLQYACCNLCPKFKECYGSLEEKEIKKDHPKG